MAYFAEIDKNNIVVRVLSVHDSEEHRGEEFLRDDLGLGGRWIQTSYNHRIRKQYAGIGYTYNLIADVFVKPQPFPSWRLDDNHDWQPPVAKPVGGGLWDWDETNQKWVEIG